MDEIFVDSKFLQLDALCALIKALLLSINRPYSSAKASPLAVVVADDDGAMLCFELLLAVCLRNRDRITALWPMLAAHFSDVFRRSQPRHARQQRWGPIRHKTVAAHLCAQAMRDLARD